ncbi:MAG: hypothetical protein KBT48_05680 [Firmicutes bacterium]|nr:hypothetical protein [Bacillota bacterium]
MNEVLKLEKADNIDELMALYEEIIEQTSNMEVYGRWKKNLYPTKEDIQAYIDTDSMYMAYEENQMIGAIGITIFQNEGYTNIRWRKDTTNVCVFHVLGVHPQYTGWTEFYFFEKRL